MFSGNRLNKEPPNLTFRKKDKGGINFTSTVANTHLDLDTVKAICSEYRMHNADITLRYDATADDLIDVIEGSRIYMPCIYVVNKIDQITLEELEILDKLPHYCPVRWLFIGLNFLIRIMVKNMVQLLPYQFLFNFTCEENLSHESVFNYLDFATLAWFFYWDPKHINLDVLGSVIWEWTFSSHCCLAWLIGRVCCHCFIYMCSLSNFVPPPSLAFCVHRGWSKLLVSFLFL